MLRPAAGLGFLVLAALLGGCAEGQDDSSDAAGGDVAMKKGDGAPVEEPAEEDAAAEDVGDDASAPDDVPPPDASAPPDVAPPPDASAPDVAVPPPDVAPPPDVPAMDVAPPPPDVASPPDVTTAPDVTRDAAADRVVAPDVAPDRVVTPDVAPPPDASTGLVCTNGLIRQTCSGRENCCVTFGPIIGCGCSIPLLGCIPRGGPGCGS